MKDRSARPNGAVVVTIELPGADALVLRRYRNERTAVQIRGAQDHVDHVVRLR
jgi:hypothetical protein